MITPRERGNHDNRRQSASWPAKIGPRWVNAVLLEVPKRQSDISAKVLKESLDWCDVAKALSRREIVGHDDVLYVLVRDLIEIGFPRQPAPQPAIGILNAAFLPGGICITEPCCHAECIAQYSVAGKTGVVVEGDRLTQYRIKSFEDGHDRTGCLGGGLAGEPGSARRVLRRRVR